MGVKGSCLCGRIRYRINGPLTGTLNCHCTMCRKAHGAAFRTRAAVKTEDFEWLAGEHLLTRYQSSPGLHKTFCSVCGSNLVTIIDSNPESLGFPLGTLDDDPGVKPKFFTCLLDRKLHGTTLPTTCRNGTKNQTNEMTGVHRGCYDLAKAKRRSRQRL